MIGRGHPRRLRTGSDGRESHGAHLVKDLTVEAGKTSAVAELTGAEALTSVKVSLDLPSDANAQRNLLRELTIAIYWDDEKEAAVWSPLGDFFGFVGGADPYQSLPMGVLADGTFYCAWYMPFARSARIVVGNDGAAARTMRWQITHQPLSIPATLARFHAKWHRDAFLPTREDRRFDWTLLTTEGRGRFVGTHLHGWNPEGGWWGEGDDKFFIDGERFPSSFGTGSRTTLATPGARANTSRGRTTTRSSTIGTPVTSTTTVGTSRTRFPFRPRSRATWRSTSPIKRGRSTRSRRSGTWCGRKRPYAPVPVTERLGYWKR